MILKSKMYTQNNNVIKYERNERNIFSPLLIQSLSIYIIINNIMIQVTNEKTV